jgi:spore germination cell wall hydrolase CwlJ-like protein
MKKSLFLVPFIILIVLMVIPREEKKPVVVVNEPVPTVEKRVTNVASTVEITEETTEEATECEPQGRCVTDEEYALLLRVCMSEAGGKYGEPLEGKVAVVETILNRCDMYGMTITEVIYERNQYSTANNGQPDETVQQAVDIALSGDMYPDNMIYFRTGKYHSFATPYKKIGSHYFSLKE